MSTHQYLRPSSTIDNSVEIVDLGGSSGLTDALSDQSDTTYVTSIFTNFAGGMDAGFASFRLTNITLGSNQRVKGLTINIRNARDSAGGATQDTMSSLVMWPNLERTAGAYLSQRTSTTITTFHGPQAVTPPGKSKEWTQTDINNASLFVRWYSSHTKPYDYQKVYDVWVDVEILTKPVVSLVTVTNTDQTGTPTVTWAYYDPDGESSRAYEVKIFSSDQYSASNFNPDKTTPAWTSGQVGSTATAIIVGAPLQNGITYKAYVRGAKIGPQVPGQSSRWFSDWASSASFTITFLPPAAPMLSTTGPLIGENMYRVPITVTAPINLLTVDNASFETSLGQWQNLGGLTMVRDTTQHASGVAAMKLTATSGPTSLHVRSDLDFFSEPRVEPGKTYTALASFKAATVARSCQVLIRWYDISDTLISTSNSSTVNDATTGWTQVSMTATAPDNAIHVRIELVISGVANAEVHYVDQVDFHVGTSTVWTGGGYVNDQGGLHIQRCEFVNDARGPARNWFQPQVASAGSASRNAGQGFSWDISNSTLVWQWLDKVITRSGYVSSGMLKWDIFNPVANQWVAFGRDYFGRTIWNPPAIPGQAYTFSVWAWTKAGTRAVHPGMVFYDASNLATSTVAGAQVTLTTTPQLLSVTSVAPTGSAYANGIVYDDVGTSVHSIYFTTAGFGPGTDPVDAYQPLGIFPHWQDLVFTGTDRNTLDFLNFPVGYTTGQTETIPDFEYPPDRPVHYRSWIEYDVTGVILRSVDSNIVPVYGPAPARTIIRSVTDNSIGCVVNRRKTISSTISQDATVIHPLGADRAPVQIRDWVGGEDGTLELIIANEYQLQRVRDLFDTSDVLVVQWAQGGRTYITVTGVTLTETVSSDRNAYCDVDGTTGHLRVIIASITYLETLSPTASTAVDS